MAALSIEIFTSPSCPHCPSAVEATKEVLKENTDLYNEVSWSEVNTGTQEGNIKAHNYGISIVPTIIITNTKTNEKFGIAGTPGKKKYAEILNKALGREIPACTAEEKEEKNSSGNFVDRFRHIFRQ